MIDLVIPKLYKPIDTEWLASDCVLIISESTLNYHLVHWNRSSSGDSTEPSLSPIEDRKGAKNVPIYYQCMAQCEGPFSAAPTFYVDTE